MRSALALVIAVGLAAHIQAEGLLTANPTARVRPMQKRVESLLATGMDRSATFRQLVRRLERSDVIVYVEARHDMRNGVGASMRFVTRSATDRFVRIQLNADYTTTRWSPCWATNCSTPWKSPNTPRCSRPTTCARSIGARACGPGPTASTRKRRGKPDTWCATRSSGSRATCAWRAAPALDETRLLDGSPIVADDHDTGPRLSQRSSTGDQEFTGRSQGRLDL